MAATRSSRSRLRCRPMAWRRNKLDESPSLDIVAADNGVIVRGPAASVSEFIDGLMETTAGADRPRRLPVDGVALAADAMAFRQTHGEYVEFSKRALELLRQHGSIPKADGYFQSFVKSGREFAGNLDWKPANLGPSQALSMQTAAAQLALRAAIKDVVAAIERVEGKVDQLVTLARAERLGAAIGDGATLQPIVDRARSSGRISTTDWSTIASLGPQIARDIERLRAYVLLQLKDVKESPFAGSRADEAKDLAKQMMKESIALLVVVEHNYGLWQELRIAHAATHERDALQHTTDDVRHQLAALTTADQHLVHTLHDVATRLLTPTGYEGFTPLQKRQLNKYGGELNDVTAWFVEQRHLETVGDGATVLPRFSESLNKVGALITTGAKATSRAIGAGSEHVIRRVRARRSAPVDPTSTDDS